MNAETSSHSTLFQDRNLDAVRSPKTPTRFSTEPEGEGMELCLRALLVVSLLAALAFCGVSPDRFANVRHHTPALPDAHTAVALAQPCVAPVAKPL